MRQITAALLGAGQRGVRAYASYALSYPNELKFVAAAEPREDRLRAFQDEHGIADENCFSSWEELLAGPRLADCILICTQDQMHYEPILRAAEKGYHILCEKPITTTKKELEDIGALARTYDKTISICHVLRYSPFFGMIKKLLNQGAIGQLISVRHMESIGFWHMAHSFVRGNWRKTEEGSPIILAKCCHDMDLLLWLVGSRCKRVSSFGDLAHFHEGNAPKDAPKHCMDGCSHRDDCPYYAPSFYLNHPKAETDGFCSVVSLDSSTEAILEALKEGPYGRCVYRCDNDVADHQIVNLEYENGVKASFTMCAFTNKCERTIQLLGTRGELKGNMEDNLIEVVDFVTGNTTSFTINTTEKGHGGSDESMMREFVELVASDGEKDNLSAAAEAVESHLIALAAEESRLNGGMAISMEEFICK